MKKLLIWSSIIYSAGTFFEYYNIPNSDPDKLKKTLFWPGYFVIGTVNTILGKGTITIFRNTRNPIVATPSPNSPVDSGGSANPDNEFGQPGGNMTTPNPGDFSTAS